MFPTLGLHATWDSHLVDPAARQVLLRSAAGDVVDSVPLPAPVVSATAADAATLAVLGTAGRLTFWAL